MRASFFNLTVSKMQVKSTSVIVGINVSQLDLSNLTDFNESEFRADNLKYMAEWTLNKFKDYDIRVFRANRDEPLVMGILLFTANDHIRTMQITQGVDKVFTTGMEQAANMFRSVMGHEPDIYILQNFT